jgi:hypothetical protein
VGRGERRLVTKGVDGSRDAGSVSLIFSQSDAGSQGAPHRHIGAQACDVDLRKWRGLACSAPPKYFFRRQARTDGRLIMAALWCPRTWSCTQLNGKYGALTEPTYAAPATVSKRHENDGCPSLPLCLVHGKAGRFDLLARIPARVGGTIVIGAIHESRPTVSAQRLNRPIACIATRSSQCARQGRALGRVLSRFLSWWFRFILLTGKSAGWPLTRNFHDL